jgi:hypothetical protein
MADAAWGVIVLIELIVFASAWGGRDCWPVRDSVHRGHRRVVRKEGPKGTAHMV